MQIAHAGTITERSSHGSIPAPTVNIKYFVTIESHIHRTY